MNTNNANPTVPTAQNTSPAAPEHTVPFWHEPSEVAYEFNNAQMVTPFWYSNVVYNENAKMVDYGGSIYLNLLFKPVRIVSVRNYSLKKTYEENVDYYVEGNRLVWKEGSKIPYTNDAAAARPFENSVWDKIENNNLNITYVYKPEDWKYNALAFKGSLLPKTMEKLADTNRPFQLCTLGDSITYGWASTSDKDINRPPYMMNYAKQVQAGLELARAGAPVRLNNPSVGGWSTQDALNNLEKVYQNFTPDLVTICYGINDTVKDLTKEQVVANIRTILERIRKQAPDVEFLIIAPISPNPYGAPKPIPMFDYSEVYGALEEEGVAFLDMFGLQEEILKVKRYCDVSGDNSCHPNDYGMRLHAMGILSTLIDYNAQGKSN